MTSNPNIDNETLLTLIAPEHKEYIKNRNRVAAITNKDIVFIKKKIWGKYYEIININRDTVTEITNSKGNALLSATGGLILVVTSILILIFGFTGRVIGPGVVVFPLTFGLMGAAMLIGFRRRIITFRSTTGKYKWVSPPLSYGKSKHYLDKIREIFKNTKTELINFD